MTADARPFEAPQERFFLGLDLGQAQDFSALVALRRRREPDPRREGATQFRYTVRGIRRWPLGTLYPAVVADVCALVSRPPLAGALLAVDFTGCGRPVVDMLRQARPQAHLRPVLITAGHAVTGDEHALRVPKRELVAAVAVLLQTGRLEIPGNIPEADVLGRELLFFRATISTSGHEQFEADWRTRAHDDLVLALAMAAWLGEHATEPTVEGPLLLYPMPEDLRVERVRAPAITPVTLPREDDPPPPGYAWLCGHLVKVDDDGDDGGPWGR